MLNRIGVAVLLVAGTRVALSQASTPTSPNDQPSSQTQEPVPGQAPNAAPGQTQSATAPPAETGVQTADTDQNAAANEQAGAQMPVPLNIDSSSLEFAGERQRASFLHGGVGGGVTYDDNLLSVTSPRDGGFAYSIVPNIGVNISRPRLYLETDYEAGYTFNQRFSAYNDSAQNAHIDLRYRLTPHVNLRLYDRFILTSGFYNQLQTGSGGLGSGVVQQPNLGVITPFTRHTYDLGTAELTYQYSASDMVGMSVTGDVSSFAAPPAGAPALVNTQSEEGDAFYTHRFTPRNWSGITYTFQRLTFDPVVETVDTHSILLFHSFYLNQNTVLSFFAGPEYTELNNDVVSTSVTLPFVTVNSVLTSQNRWSVGGGGSFSWKGQRTSVRLSGARKVSDGGGLLTAVDVTSGIGAVRRQLARNSSLELGGLYASSRAIDQGSTTTYNNVKAASGSLLFEQTLGRNLTARFGFARDYQQQSAATLPTQNINHNRGWITIGYNFSRPLGR